jgi:hypothetical protein
VTLGSTIFEVGSFLGNIIGFTLTTLAERGFHCPEVRSFCHSTFLLDQGLIKVFQDSAFGESVIGFTLTTFADNGFPFGASNNQAIRPTIDLPPISLRSPEIPRLTFFSILAR